MEIQHSTGSTFHNNLLSITGSTLLITHGHNLAILHFGFLLPIYLADSGRNRLCILEIKKPLVLLIHEQTVSYYVEWVYNIIMKKDINILMPSSFKIAIQVEIFMLHKHCKIYYVGWNNCLLISIR